jgi:hypothetical protein
MWWWFLPPVTIIMLFIGLFAISSRPAEIANPRRRRTA